MNTNIDDLDELHLKALVNELFMHINVYIDGMNTRRYDITMTKFLEQNGYTKTSGELLAWVKKYTE
jgi:hypothetical protein